VLVVDDDPAVLDSLQTLLEMCGFLVRCVAGVGEAMLELNAQRPDVVVTDLYMARGDGFELINAMRQFQAVPPIVAMSSGANELPLAKLLDASETVEKPFTGVELVAAVNRAVDGARSAYDVATQSPAPTVGS
jgi:DNA-binding response OmpR family regulator